MRNVSIAILFLFLGFSFAMAFYRAAQKDFMFAFLWMLTAFTNVSSLLLLVV